MKPIRLLLVTLLLLTATSPRAVARNDGYTLAEVYDSTVVDSAFLGSVSTDSASTPKPKKQSFFKKIGNGIISFFEEFSNFDTTYIEPQHYNYAAMLQNTNTQEVYRISNNDGFSVTFAPQWNYKLGPYFGWRWIFLGYTLDINHLDLSHDDRQRQELDLSLYTNLFGIDLYYRKSGDDYKVRRMRLGDGVDTKPMKGSEFHGFRSSVKGFNIYYILNHHKFSYPAAFSQSTVQRRSAGTPLLGFAYTVHKVSVDWTQLQDLIDQRLDLSDFEAPQDSNYRGFNIKYLDVSFSGGYAYNWVFARNWLFSASLSVALAYKHSYGGPDKSIEMRKGFSFHNFGFDGINRLGLVYNNSKWYFGINSTLNAFNYDKSNFSLNTFFGNLNFYVGFNFGKKKE